MKKIETVFEKFDEKDLVDAECAHQLFCIIDDYASECGWVNDTQFCVWINYEDLAAFINELKEVFSAGIFDDGAFDCNMQETGVCIDLCKALEGYISLEDVFDKEAYEH